MAYVSKVTGLDNLKDTGNPGQKSGPMTVKISDSSGNEAFSIVVQVDDVTLGDAERAAKEKTRIIMQEMVNSLNQ